MTLCSHLNKPHTAVEFGLIETIQQTKTTPLINLFLLFVLRFSAFCFLAVEFLSSCNLLQVSEILIMFSVTINLPGNDYRLPSFFFICTNILITARHVPPRRWFSTVWLSLWLWSTTQETNEGLNLCRAAVSIIEILPMIMCEEYNENFGLRGKWSWIIVSSIIIS